MEQHPGRHAPHARSPTAHLTALLPLRRLIVMPAFPKPADAFHHGNLKAAAISVGVAFIRDGGAFALMPEQLVPRLGVTG